MRHEGVWERPRSVAHAKEDEFQRLVQDVFPAGSGKPVRSAFGGREGGSDQTRGTRRCRLHRSRRNHHPLRAQAREERRLAAGGSRTGVGVRRLLCRHAFEEFAARVSDRLDTDLVGAMGEAAAEDFDPVAWTEAVDGNLRSGTFRLVVAVDALTDALCQTVLYLNERCAFPLVAAELRLVTEQGVEVLVRRLFGEEAAERKLERRTRAAPTVRNPDVVIVPAARRSTSRAHQGQRARHQRREATRISRAIENPPAEFGHSGLVPDHQHRQPPKHAASISHLSLCSASASKPSTCFETLDAIQRFAGKEHETPVLEPLCGVHA